MTQVKSPGSPAAPPPAQTPQAPGSTGALGLGVDVGVVVDPSAGTAYETPSHVVDRYDESARRGDETRDESIREAPKSPFEKLARRRDAPKREVSDKKVSTDKELDVDPSLLGKLASAEGKLGPEHAGAFDKIRLGTMLLGSDAQDASKLGRGDARLESLAQKMLGSNKSAAEADAKAFAKLYARFLAGGKKNVQAYVQRALRECYLIQNGLLHDYAMKVRHYNELRRKTRAILEKARSTKSAWVSEKQAKGKSAEEYYIADTWFQWLELDENGNEFTPVMTEEDVASWKKVDEARRKAAGGGSAADAYESLYGESGLSADDRDVLNEMKKDRGRSWNLIGGDSDNYIRDNIDDLLPLLPKMNASDIKIYLTPILDHLLGGNADEDELLQIFDHLSPAQFVYVMSGCLDESQLGDEHSNYRALLTTAGAVGGFLAGGLAGVLTAPVGGYLGGWVAGRFGGVFNEEEMSEFNLIARKAARAVAGGLGVEFVGDLDAQKAANLIAAVRAKHRADEQAAANPTTEGADGTPKVGDPKQIRTIEGMESYIKNMEDRLQSIGDDAQLANVDLQDALQKQQHTLQMMSNMSKMLHDTAMAIVRRIGQ